MKKKNPINWADLEKEHEKNRKGILDLINKLKKGDPRWPKEAGDVLIPLLKKLYEKVQREWMAVVQLKALDESIEKKRPRDFIRHCR